jgi:hypothetical protein
MAEHIGTQHVVCIPRACVTNVLTDIMWLPMPARSRVGPEVSGQQRLGGG